MQSKSSDNGHGAIITPNLRTFTYAELKSATRKFSPDTVLGKGVCGLIFKGWVDRETLASSKPGVGMPVTIMERMSWQALREWQAEVEFLGKLSHPNLVKPLGYCMEDERYLQVYEYMEKGSLETHLFREGGDPIPWDKRLNIATGAARGLTFLHKMENQVIDYYFDTSNILLDGDFNAKLLDFGWATLVPADGDTYTKHWLSMKTDVISFGVTLLQLLTGRKLIYIPGEQNLMDWTKPSLSKKRKLEKIMDPRLENQYPPKAAFEAAKLVLKCLKDPKNRPPMEEVLVTLEHINSIKMNPKVGKKER